MVSKSLGLNTAIKLLVVFCIRLLKPLIDKISEFKLKKLNVDPNKE